MAPCLFYLCIKVLVPSVAAVPAVDAKSDETRYQVYDQEQQSHVDVETDTFDAQHLEINVIRVVITVHKYLPLIPLLTNQFWIH